MLTWWSKFSISIPMYRSTDRTPGNFSTTQFRNISHSAGSLFFYLYTLVSVEFCSYTAPLGPRSSFNFAWIHDITGNHQKTTVGYWTSWKFKYPWRELGMEDDRKSKIWPIVPDVRVSTYASRYSLRMSGQESDSALYPEFRDQVSWCEAVWYLCQDALN